MHYIFSEGGLSNELALISHAETIDHLRNYLGNFLLDSMVCAVYANRLGTIPADEQSESVRNWARYLFQKYAKLNSLDENAVSMWANLSGNVPSYLRDLSKCRLPEKVQDWLDNASWSLASEKLRPRLLDLFKSYPYSPQIISRLIESDLQLNVPAGQQWRDQVRLPPSLQPIFSRVLLEAYHLQEDNDRAMELLSTLPTQSENEIWLNTAAEIFARSGDRQQAARLYMDSLRLDPHQGPIPFRLNALANPFVPDPATLASQTAIFLYSWNKCDLLRNTLKSLAESDTGSASISVLLNGCTDSSREMLENINGKCFENRIKIIELPINIGAPAARNWLLATPEARQVDYVAFLDDDVDVPKNWLSSLLTVLRDNPDAGVAGGKVLNLGMPRRLQYVFRNIAIAREGLVRLSLATPQRNFDSGIYDFIRETDNVMGCCHVFTRAALDAVPFFDIRFSPSQMDDISHDLDLRIKGFKIMYCGHVACTHHQMSGMGRSTPASLLRKGNVLGNDVKFVYKYIPHLDALKKMNNLQTE